MSRNARSDENGRFYEISSHRVNVNGFEDFCEFQLNSSKRNQLGKLTILKNFSQIRQSKSAWRI